MFEPKVTRRVDRIAVVRSRCARCDPVVRGIADTESLVLAAQEAGAVAVLQVDATDILHEDIVTTTWGADLGERWAEMPDSVRLITKSDGDRLMSAAAKEPITGRTRDSGHAGGWRTVPIVVADVPGRTPDFVLVATHLDAWYHGMTDTGGSVATILDMARVSAPRGRIGARRAVRVVDRSLVRPLRGFRLVRR